jgi:hypothetical protein
MKPEHIEEVINLTSLISTHLKSAIQYQDKLDSLMEDVDVKGKIHLSKEPEFRKWEAIRQDCLEQFGVEF